MITLQHTKTLPTNVDRLVRIWTLNASIVVGRASSDHATAMTTNVAELTARWKDLSALDQYTIAHIVRYSIHDKNRCPDRTQAANDLANKLFAMGADKFGEFVKYYTNE